MDIEEQDSILKLFAEETHNSLIKVGSEEMIW